MAHRMLAESAKKGNLEGQAAALNETFDALKRGRQYSSSWIDGVALVDAAQGFCEETDSSRKQDCDRGMKVKSASCRPLASFDVV